MKLTLFTAGLLFMTPAVAYGAEAQNPTSAETAKKESRIGKSATLTSSNISQTVAIQSIYARESGIDINTVYLENSSAAGIYAKQVTDIDNAGVVNSNVNINSIAAHSGHVGSSVITQSAYVNGMEIRSSTLELNRVILD